MQIEIALVVEAAGHRDCEVSMAGPQNLPGFLPSLQFTSLNCGIFAAQFTPKWQQLATVVVSEMDSEAGRKIMLAARSRLSMF